MTNNIITLAAFEAVLNRTDWDAQNRPVDAAAFVNGRASIAFTADCFLSLTAYDQALAKNILQKRLPLGWKGWPVVVKAAKIRRMAFQKAVAIGTFSDNQWTDNYYGDYFYCHSEGGKDYFRHKRTFQCVASPYTKEEIAKQASARIFWFLPKEERA